ncbi:cytidylate kinase-like family protein [Neobittarella massiliensis]|uniref:cytidylate kinase-like family protein n=1 Tax=Neobittarella massiliensis (ex Bilen et al. 2018) TaxID=2041842 RepID=UPI0024365254|nr:cytidylate kinase-like family protein [Neobittarella massiliensis]
MPPVITISRQHGSGGRMVGHQLSQQLKIPFYDHEIIERAVNSSTIDQSFFEEAETRWAGSLLDGLSRDVGQGLSVDDQVFLHQSQIIRQIASENSCIIVGRCADQVLKDRQNVIRVFIYADRKSRQHRLIHTYHETTDHALADIERTDKRRASYYSFYSGRQFGDADNYDICLNSSALGIDGCVQILKDVYRSLSAATQEP